MFLVFYVQRTEMTVILAMKDFQRGKLRKLSRATAKNRLRMIVLLAILIPQIITIYGALSPQAQVSTFQQGQHYLLYLKPNLPQYFYPAYSLLIFFPIALSKLKYTSLSYLLLMYVSLNAYSLNVSSVETENLAYFLQCYHQAPHLTYSVYSLDTY